MIDTSTAEYALFQDMIQSIADGDPQNAAMIEIGAMSVLGILSISIQQLLDDVSLAAMEEGCDPEECRKDLSGILARLVLTMEPRIHMLNEATTTAQDRGECDE